MRQTRKSLTSVELVAVGRSASSLDLTRLNDVYGESDVAIAISELSLIKSHMDDRAFTNEGGFDAGRRTQRQI